MSSVGRCVDDGFGSVIVTSTANGKYPICTGFGHCCSSVNVLSKYLWYFSDFGRFTSPAKPASVFPVCTALARQRRLNERLAHMAMTRRWPESYRRLLTAGPKPTIVLFFYILGMLNSIDLQHGAAFRVLACAGDGLLFRITSGSHHGGDCCAYLYIYNSNNSNIRSAIITIKKIVLLLLLVVLLL